MCFLKAKKVLVNQYFIPNSAAIFMNSSPMGFPGCLGLAGKGNYF
jgi:hypothetical protein